MKNQAYFILALICLAVVSIDIYWWISITMDTSKPFEVEQAEYYQKFPTFLRNGRLITVLNIVLLSLSSLLFFKSTSVARLKGVSWVLMDICWVLLAWQIFTLL